MDLQRELKRAQSLQRDGRMREAATLYGQLSVVAPDAIGVWAGLGMVMHDLGDLQAAENAFQRTIELRPQLGSAHVVLGSVSRQLGKLDEAAIALGRALSIDNANPSAHANLGLVQLDQGRLTEALQSFGRAVALDPGNTQALIALSSLRRARPGDAAFATLQALSESQKISRRDHANIHFSLGKMYADVSDYAASWTHYRRANQLQHVEDLFLGREFQAQAHAARIAALMALQMPTTGQVDGDGARPVFILGLPRSGKSLLESLLAGHKRCTDLRESRQIFAKAVAAQLLPLTNAGLAAPTTLAWGRALRDELTVAHGDGTLLYTLPEYMELVPLLAFALPEARFVFLTRDLRDLGLSCYFKDLRVAHNYSNHLESLGTVFRQDRQLARHYQDALTGRWTTVSYEDLVTDPEQTVRGVLDFLALDFQAECLPPTESSYDITQAGPARSLQSPSALTDSFIGLWRQYPAAAIQLMIHGGQASEAVGLCRELLEKTPDDPQLLAALALALGHMGEFPEALSASLSAIALETDNPDHFVTRARIHAVAGDFDSAVEDYWSALSIRPYTLEMPRVQRAMLAELRHIDPALASLHDDVMRLFHESRQVFGDFGMLYQAYEPLRLAGHRPARERYDIYRLDKVLTGKSRVLDIGCNAGFLALLCAEKAAQVDAFDIEPNLVAIGRRVAEHLQLTNIRFQACGFDDFLIDGQYDLIFSFAVHHWIGLPMARYAARLDSWLAPGGVIVFESQGRRSSETVEENLDEKIGHLLALGMEVLWEGELLDDGMNKRTFAVLRRHAATSVS